MPITFDEANDFWELTDPTTQEKAALTRIAITDITEHFGHEIAERILEQAKKQVTSTTVPVKEGGFSTGEVGNA